MMAKAKMTAEQVARIIETTVNESADERKEVSKFLRKLTARFREGLMYWDMEMWGHEDKEESKRMHFMDDLIIELDESAKEFEKE